MSHTGNDFHSEAKVVARKPHQCCEGGCRRVIVQGVAYVRIRGVFDRDFYSVASCKRCVRLRQKAWARYGEHYDYDGGPVFGGLLEWLREARR